MGIHRMLTCGSYWREHSTYRGSTNSFAVETGHEGNHAYRVSVEQVHGACMDPVDETRASVTHVAVAHVAKTRVF